MHLIFLIGGTSFEVRAGIGSLRGTIWYSVTFWSCARSGLAKPQRSASSLPSISTREHCGPSRACATLRYTSLSVVPVVAGLVDDVHHRAHQRVLGSPSSGTCCRRWTPVSPSSLFFLPVQLHRAEEAGLRRRGYIVCSMAYAKEAWCQS